MAKNSVSEKLKLQIQLERVTHPWKSCLQQEAIESHNFIEVLYLPIDFYGFELVTQLLLPEHRCHAGAGEELPFINKL